MRSMVQVFVSALVIVLGSHQALQAQAVTPRGIETNSGPLIPFLEGTDVFISLERTPDETWRRNTVFEGDIFPHLVVYQNFTDVIDVGRQGQRVDPRRIAWVISGTPAVRIRMFDEVSSPVRTPSYMPRGNVQMILARGIREALASEGKGSRVTLWEGHAIIGHHSNGQDGCLYQDEIRNGEICERVVSATARHIINTKDGSFSTNYARLGVNFRRNYLDSDLWARREWGLRADFEPHFRMDPLIRDLYGRTRFEFAGSFANRETRSCRRRLEVSASAKVIKGADADVWPVAITAQASCFPFARGGWGFFVRYYGGQDYYNVGFLQNVQRLQVGATFNQGGFFRFQRPATK